MLLQNKAFSIALLIGWLVLSYLSVLYVDANLRDYWSQHWLAASGSQYRHMVHQISSMGGAEYFLVPATLLGLYALYRSRQATGVIRDQLILQANKWLFLFCAVAGSGIMARVFKATIGRARPFKAEDHTAVYPFTLESDFSAYPSAHTSVIFGLAFAVSALWPRLTIPVFIYACIIGCTRIILTKHYLSDVMGGVLLGCVCVLLLKLYFRRLYGMFQ